MDPANVTALTPPKYPVGRVDFNKPIEVFDQYNDDEALSPGTVIYVLDNSAGYPVIVKFDDSDNSERAVAFDTDGDSEGGDFTVRNSVVLNYPLTVYGVLNRDGDGLNDLQLFADVFATEEEAKVEAAGHDIIFPIVINGPISDNVVFKSEETSVLEAAIAPTAEQLASLPPGSILQAYHAGTNRNLKVGDLMRAYRNGRGWRNVEIVKVRDRYNKHFMVKAGDGTNPYWALDKNITDRLPEDESAHPAEIPAGGLVVASANEAPADDFDDAEDEENEIHGY